MNELRKELERLKMLLERVEDERDYILVQDEIITLEEQIYEIERGID
jgi:hypothetical protein